MEEINNGYEDFASAFGVEDGNHTEPTESMEATEPEAETEEASVEATEGAEGSETESDTSGAEEAEPAAEEAAEPSEEPQNAEPVKYSIKIDGQTREATIEELTELAQKGGAFDRVKGQLTETRQTVQKLQDDLAKSSQGNAFFERFKAIADEAKVSPDDLLKRIRVNLRMNGGETEREAIARIEAEDAKREVEALKTSQKPAQESPQDRMKREVAEFRAEHPNVELSEQLISELIQDVQNGMSLTKAYEKREAGKAQAEKEALQKQIKELQVQLEAEKKNRRNKASTPGSQKDSGGQRGASEFDDFLAAFQ